jgi:hypothetical protein
VRVPPRSAGTRDQRPSARARRAANRAHACGARTHEAVQPAGARQLRHRTATRAAAMAARASASARVGVSARRRQRRQRQRASASASSAAAMRAAAASAATEAASERRRWRSRCGRCGGCRCCRRRCRRRTKGGGGGSTIAALGARHMMAEHRERRCSVGANSARVCAPGDAADAPGWPAGTAERLRPPAGAV